VAIKIIFKDFKHNCNTNTATWYTIYVDWVSRRRRPCLCYNRWVRLYPPTRSWSVLTLWQYVRRSQVRVHGRSTGATSTRSTAAGTVRVTTSLNRYEVEASRRLLATCRPSTPTVRPCEYDVQNLLLFLS